jgi:hypothetical protein
VQLQSEWTHRTVVDLPRVLLGVLNCCQYGVFTDGVRHSRERGASKECYGGRVVGIPSESAVQALLRCEALRNSEACEIECSIVGCLLWDHPSSIRTLTTDLAPQSTLIH